MGHSRADKERTHERIVRLASKRFREKGLEGIGIADIMKEAGLTVGGFYKHFDSRDALVTEAIQSALRMPERRLNPPPSNRSLLTYESVINNYLTESHRDQPGTGCPVAALSGDVARAGKESRALVTADVQESIDFLAGLIRKKGESNEETARSQAILAYCALIGSLTVSRAVSNEKLSREVLETVALLLKNL